jgi:DNA polymerase-3 subunit alpha
MSNFYKFPVSSDQSLSAYFKNIVLIGLQKRLNTKLIPENYLKRVNFEIKVIIEKKFIDYFLIVADIIAYAKKQKILTGPGRGSVAGSLVAYALGITEIDPLKYGLVFERFLNLNRTSLPDIDIDFQDNRRMEIIHFLINKYGVNHVAQITTFQHYTSRLALRELGRILKINYQELDEICKLVNDNDFEQNKPNSLRLTTYLQKYPKLFEYAKQVINLPRQIGTHAAGVIISDVLLTTILPVQRGNENIIQSQFSSKIIEQLGLLKLDLLGLTTLTITFELQQIINQKETSFTFNKISIHDEQTFKLLSSGKTTTIFQLESNGIKQLLIKVKPKNIKELATVLALYRPGPMKYISKYIENKLNPQKINYFHPTLQKHLKETYGIIIFQEQVINVLSEIANFSFSEAESIRQNLNKKNLNLTNLMKKKFYQHVN